MARILITGAHGFIGTHLARRLALGGHEIVGVGHGQWPPEAARLAGVSQWVNGEITSTNLRLACADGPAPQRVYHLAGGSAVGVAIANPREDFFRTVASTAELLDWMRLDAPGARLVAVSSAAVYGAGHLGPIREDARLAPYSPYGHHKAMMEALCRSYADSYGLEFTIARLFSVYGPGLRKQLLWDLCSRLQAGTAPLQLGGSGRELRDWTAVGDVVRALDLIGADTSLSGQTVNLGRGSAHEVREIATWLLAAWRREAGGEPVDLAFSGLSRPGDPFSLVADAARLQQLDFAWSVSPEDGLADYVRWFSRPALAGNSGLTRVAFSLIGGRVWTGGNNYLRNLLDVLARHQRAAIQPVVFVGTDTEPHERAPFERIEGVEVVCSSLMNAARKTRSLLQSLLIGRDVAMLGLYKSHHIDCVFEAATVLGWRAELPAVAWMPDLQHRELPGLFTPLAWWKRELGFRAQIAAGRTVLVSSEHTREACERLYPATRGRVQAVRFAVPAPAAIEQAAARAIADEYKLPEHFFFLPNQFWTHKNHQLVVDALAQLKREGRGDIVVAATGKPFDPRDPGHFDRLRASIVEQGVQAQMRILGLVPYEHLAPLMASGDALLNPSLLEGWSTTVEEARARGAPMILSDLPVHREQMGAAAVYFDPHDAGSLAAALRHWRPLDPAERHARAEAAATEAAHRIAVYAQDFAHLIELTCKQEGTSRK